MIQKEVMLEEVSPLVWHLRLPFYIEWLLHRLGVVFFATPHESPVERFVMIYIFKWLEWLRVEKIRLQRFMSKDSHPWMRSLKEKPEEEDSIFIPRFILGRHYWLLYYVTSTTSCNLDGDLLPPYVSSQSCSPCIMHVLCKTVSISLSVFMKSNINHSLCNSHLLKNIFDILVMYMSCKARDDPMLLLLLSDAGIWCSSCSSSVKRLLHHHEWNKCTV